MNNNLFKFRSMRWTIDPNIYLVAFKNIPIWYIFKQRGKNIQGNGMWRGRQRKLDRRGDNHGSTSEKFHW